MVNETLTDLASADKNDKCPSFFSTALTGTYPKLICGSFEIKFKISDKKHIQIIHMSNRKIQEMYR